MQIVRLILLLSIVLSPVLKAESEWVINQKDADIRAFIEQVAQITGKTFIIDPTVKGKISIISTEGSSKSEVYDIFLGILDMYGYAAITNNDITTIVKQSDVKSKSNNLNTKVTESNQVVTRIIFVRNRSVMELVPLLRPIVAKYGHLAGVNSANAIIITDSAGNIKRIEALIGSLDILNSEEIEVIQLQEAWVGDIVGLLERLVPEELAATKDQNRSSGRIRVVADERSNSIILKGEASYRERIRILIKTLDQPSAQNASSKVIFLNNASAVKMAELLTGFSGAVEKSQESSGTQSRPSSPTAILADEDLNALVIRAEPTILSEIQRVVDSLDVPRAQVLIEAAIVEVSGSVSDQFGVQWATNPDAVANGTLPFAAATQFTEAGNSLGNIATSAATTGLPALGNGLLLGLVDGDVNFGAIIQAIESQSNANLLSTPSIMTLDNNEASLLVGGTVPFRTTSQQSGTGNPFETISREDVGTTLKVTPHIQNDGYVSLDVEQKTESVIPKSDVGAVDLQTSKREITTKVLVQNGQTIILGGLIKEDITQGVSRVPLLGNLPFVGMLFRSKFETREKVNLLVFIRPTIVRDKVQEMSDAKLQGVWELRIDGTNQNPKFEQLFQGDIH